MYRYSGIRTFNLGTRYSRDSAWGTAPDRQTFQPRQFTFHVPDAREARRGRPFVELLSYLPLANCTVAMYQVILRLSVTPRRAAQATWKIFESTCNIWKSLLKNFICFWYNLMYHFPSEYILPHADSRLFTIIPWWSQRYWINLLYEPLTRSFIQWFFHR